jgi:hypothetical protein
MLIQFYSISRLFERRCGQPAQFALAGAVAAVSLLAGGININVLSFFFSAAVSA